MEPPRLKLLHNQEALIPAKLIQINLLSTEQLMDSLRPGKAHCLKTRPDGTILDGNHRIHILMNRNIDVDVLPREVIEKDGH